MGVRTASIMQCDYCHTVSDIDVTDKNDARIEFSFEIRPIHGDGVKLMKITLCSPRCLRLWTMKHLEDIAESLTPTPPGEEDVLKWWHEATEFRHGWRERSITINETYARQMKASGRIPLSKGDFWTITQHLSRRGVLGVMWRENVVPHDGVKSTTCWEGRQIKREPSDEDRSF